MRTFTQKWAFLLMALLCLVVSPQVVFADDDCLVIGNGTATSSWHLPISTYYHNSYSQQLFLADEITDGAGQITEIAFQYNTATSTARTISIYMANTSVADLSSGFVTDNLVEVLSPQVVTFSNSAEWSSIELETPFDYDGTNLVIAVYMNYSSAETNYGGGYRFVQTSATGMARYISNDTATPDQISLTNNAPTASGDVADYRNNIQLCIVAGDGPRCDKPSTLQVSDITTDAAALSWADGSGVYNVEYKVDTATEWTSLLANSNAVSASLSGLDANTTYNVRVQSVCSVLDTVSSWRSTSFKTACGMITSFPYMQDFEDLAVQIFPACWDNSGSASTTASGSYSYYVWGVYAYNGNKMIRMYNFSVQNGTALINTPSIVLPDGQEFELTFDYSHRASCGELIVKLSEDGGENWTDLQSFAKGEGTSYTDPGTFNEAVISLAEYAGKTIMLQFYSLADYGSGAIFVDNIAIGKHTDCAAPVDLAASEITKSSASIGWTAGGAETAWVMQYKKAADADWQSINVSENPYSLEELDAYTEYNVRIAASCAEDEQSKYSKSISFKTAAGIPFTENFNASSIPSDWKRYAVILDTLLNGDTALVSPVTYGGWTAGSSNGVFPGQNYHLQMEIYGTSRNHWIVSPAVELEENVQLTFDLALTKYSGTLSPVTPGEQEDDKFYVLYSLDNGETWDILKYWDNSSSDEQYDLINCSADGQAVKIDLSEYAGQSMTFAFYGESSVAGGDNNIHISNVRVDYIPTCAKPVGLAVSNISDTSATFNWDEAEDGAAGWQFALIANPSADTIPAEEAFVGATGEQTVTIDTLSENTPYTFFLRSDCDGEYSEYIARSFRTLPTPKVAPWSENFDSMTVNTIPEFWDNSASTTSSATSSYGYYNVWGVFSPSGSTNRMIRMNNYSVSTGTALINTPHIILPAEEKYELSFDYSHTASCGDFIVKISTDMGASWQDLKSFGKTTDGTDYTNPGTFANATINLAAYSGENIMIQFYAAANYGNGAIFVDNVDIHVLPDCLKPVDLEAAEATTSSISVNWQPQGEEQYWLIQYKKSADEEWIYVADSVKAHPCVISGLEASSVYNVRVAAWCDPADSLSASDFSNPLATATECDIISSYPYIANFDELDVSSTTRALPVCWSGINTTTYETYQKYPTAVQDEIAPSAPNALVFYSYGYSTYDPQDQYAILPQMENISGLRIKLSAAAYADYYGTIYDATFSIGVMSDPEDVSTFVEVASFCPTTEDYEQFKASFAEYTGEGQYIAIKMLAASSSYRVVFIDNIVIDEIPTCLEPEGLKATLANGDGTKASLSWNPGTASNWVVEYATSADFAEAVSIEASEVASAALSGLTPETEYFARVKAVCGGTDGESQWSEVISFIPSNDFIVNDSTATNDRVPVYGLYVDNLTRSQFIVPAEELVSLQWDSITALTFYSSNMNVSWGAARFEVYVAEVSDPALTALRDWDSMDLVKNAAELSIVGGKMVVSFDAPYQYQGGNLLIGIKQTIVGSYSSCTWYGKVSPSASFGGYANSVAQQNFGPKMKIDYVEGVAPSCLKVKDLAISEITASSAKLSWTAPEGQTEWQIALSTEADFNPDEVTPIVADVNPIDLSELTEETTYYIYVRAKCGEGDFSVWSKELSFATVAACQTPAELAVASITEASAEISWNGFGQTGFNLRYSINGLNWLDTIEDIASPYTLENLDPNTAYYVQVQVECESNWSSSLQFKTKCAAEAFPWTEDFEGMNASAVPDCWDNSASTSTTLTGSYPYYIWGVYSYGGNKMIRMNNYSVQSGLAVINTPAIVLPATPAELYFEYSHTATCGEFIVKVSEDMGATWTDLQSFAKGEGSDNADPGTFSEAEISLADYAGKTIMLQFYATANYDYGAIFVDNVSVREIPACPKTTGLNLVSVSATEASFAWDAEEDVTWEYGIVLDTVADFVPADADFTATASVNTVSIDTLSAQTNYLFFLRKVCGEDKSEIVYLAFKTTAVPASLPYDDGFEAGNNWELINGTMANAWVVGAAENNGGANALYISNDGGATNAYSNSAATVYAAKLFDFNESGSYTVSYDWKANGESTYDYLRVVLVPGTVELTASTSLPSGLTASAVPANWIALDEGTKLNLSTEWANKSVEVEVEPGLYYVVFVWRNDGSGGDQTPAAIDNIHIQHLAYPTGIESGAGIENQAVKFIHNDHVYILLNGNVYTVTGQKVELK